MSIRPLSLRRSGLALLATVFAICAIETKTVFAEGDPTDKGTSEGRAQDAVRKKRHRATHKASPKPVVVTQSAESKTDATTTVATAAAASKAPSPKATDDNPTAAIDFAAQLDKAGASTCRGQVNALATSTMQSVEKFNTVSNWSQNGGDKRAVSLAIGQKFAAGSAVPFGISQIISAPNAQGSCDGFTVQVFPSPLSCTKLRETIVAQRGQQIGDLAGIPLMQDTTGRTMLVPTAADTCVLVATRTYYPK